MKHGNQENWKLIDVVSTVLETKLLGHKYPQNPFESSDAEAECCSTYDENSSFNIQYPVAVFLKTKEDSNVAAKSSKANNDILARLLIENDRSSRDLDPERESFCRISGFEHGFT